MKIVRKKREEEPGKKKAFAFFSIEIQPLSS